MTRRGTVDASPDAEVTGIEMSSNLGTVTAFGESIVPVTGQALTITQGTAQAFTDVVTEDVTGMD